mmetsp:Transcript_559/g.783  ORF Transcript_559/g.783 Transcript_559/m.783 type:complete len:159 (-) Transcript_559:78-554(-)
MTTASERKKDDARMMVEKRGVSFDDVCRLHGVFMVVFGVSILFICLVEQVEFLSGMRAWGLRLDMLYKGTYGSEPHVNAIYRCLAFVFLAIGLYEFKFPDLDGPNKAFFKKIFVAWLAAVGVSFAYDAISSYSAPLTVLTAACPLSFALAGAVAPIRR